MSVLGVICFSYMMCGSIDELKSLAGWDGANGQSRLHLLIILQGR